MNAPANNGIRVALFTDSDEFAGTERHMLELAGGLRALGLHPSLACPSPSPLAAGAVAQGIAVVPIAKRGTLDWRAIRVLTRMLKSNQIDLIHAHNGRTGLSAAIAVSLAARGGFVTTQHFLKPGRMMRSGLSARVSARLHHWVAGRAGRMISVSQAVRDEMLRRGDAPSDRIRVVPNGVCVPQLPTLADRLEARRSIGIDPEVPVILSAARLEPEKDMPTLVRAMGCVTQTVPRTLCLIAGEGSQRPAIEQEIARLGLGDRIRLLGFRGDMRALFLSCDLFVLPSIAEPFGLVLLEAMAHGCAVIATRAGGPIEIVSDRETGLLVPAGDPAALHEAICTLIRDKDLCRQMGERGYQRVREKFSVARMARATADVYEEALRTAPG